jgi:hypothetical protein
MSPLPAWDKHEYQGDTEEDPEINPVEIFLEIDPPGKEESIFPGIKQCRNQGAYVYQKDGERSKKMGRAEEKSGQGIEEHTQEKSRS